MLAAIVASKSYSIKMDEQGFAERVGDEVGRQMKKHRF